MDCRWSLLSPRSAGLHAHRHAPQRVPRSAVALAPQRPRHSTAGRPCQRSDDHLSCAASQADALGSDFRSWFDEADFADVQLRLQPGSANSSDRLYRVHTILMATRSGRFKTMLMDRSGQQPEDSKAAGIRKLTVHVQPDEVDAMDLLLRLIYSFKPPYVTADNLPLLFQCLRLADSFESPLCTDLLLEHVGNFASMNPGLVWHLAYTINLPASILDRPACKRMFDSCRKFLEKEYGDVPEVIRSEQLRRGFCSLPFAAVLSWAESDRLGVDNENSVVYLLSAWVKAAQVEGGQGVSSEQLQQLVQQVRVVQLGPAFLQHILPQLEWFKASGDLKWLPALLTCKHWMAVGKNGHSRKPSDVWPDRNPWPGPWQWLSPPRSDNFWPDTWLDFEVSFEELQQLRIGERCFAKDTSCVGGFHMCMWAEVMMVEWEGACLCLFCGPHTSQVGGAASWPDGAVVIAERSELKLPWCDIDAYLYYNESVITACTPYSWNLGPVQDLPSNDCVRDGWLRAKVKFEIVDRVQ